MSVSKIERLKKELKTAIRDEDFDLALDVVEDMLDLDEDNPKFWNSRGVVLAKMGDVDQSLDSFDTAIEIDPEDSNIWYSKGCVLMDNGKLRAGLGCFYKSLDLEPTNEKARERFLRCLDTMGMYSTTQSDEAAAFSVEDEGEIETIEPSPAREVYHEMPSEADVVPEAGESSMEPFDEQESLEKAESIRRKKSIRGTFLDEDMFGEEIDEWSEEEEEEYEEEEEDYEEPDIEDEEWDIEEVEEEEEEPYKIIRCKCGGEIPIYTRKRPARFECPECGRTGTLKG